MNKIDMLKSRQKQHSDNISETKKFVDAFIDEMSFVEFNDYLTYSDKLDAASDAVLTGHATIDGRPIAIAAQNSTVNQGGFSSATAEKLKRLLQFASDKGIPAILVLDSFGANVDEGTGILGCYADVLTACRQATEFIPVIAVIKGYAVGGAALLSSCCDFRIAMKSSVMSFNSPAVVLSSQGKLFEPERYFGGKLLHDNGFAAIYAEHDLKSTLSKVMGYIPLTLDMTSPEDESVDFAPYNTEVEGIEGMQGKELICALCDDDSFVELYGGYAKGICCGFARVGGKPVLFTANVRNEGGNYITPAIARKSVKINSLAYRYNLPIVRLVDCEGIAISTDNEQNASFMDDLARLKEWESDTPRITVITGSGVGIGYTLMVDNSDNRTVAAWSTAQISPLTAAAGGYVMYSDKLKGAKDVFKAREEIAELYKQVDGDAFSAATSGLVNHVINPEDTKQYLLSMLQLATL